MACWLMCATTRTPDAAVGAADGSQPMRAYGAVGSNHLWEVAPGT
jgi:hypothetical protein